MPPAVRFQLLRAVRSEEPPARSEMLGAGCTAPVTQQVPWGWGPTRLLWGRGVPLGPEGKVNKQSVGARVQTITRLYCSKRKPDTESRQGAWEDRAQTPRVGEPWPPRRVTCPL